MTTSRSIKHNSLLLLSVALLCAGIWIAGIDKVFEDMRSFPVWIVAAVLIAFALNLAAVSFRLGLLLKYFDFNVPYSIVFKTSAQGHFSSLFFTSLIGQVVGRQVILKNYEVPPINSLPRVTYN